MPALPFVTWMALALLLAGLSALLCAASIRYAHQRRMLDLPGQRRSHTQPTPRGGGIGMAVAALVGIAVLGALGSLEWMVTTRLFIATALVAVIGWIDDHRSLGAGVRLLVHGLAAGVLLMPLPADWAGNPAALWIVLGSAVGMLAMVWSVNLHNFMDGINGLLTCQAIFVFAALALSCAREGQMGEAGAMALAAIGAAAFLPFNFPTARTFMGDVGSGVLGLLLAVAIGVHMAMLPGLATLGLIASSAFLVDSGATLLSRMLMRRRWYSAHREHLYQWLVRCGWNHARVVAAYMAWNSVVAVPTMLWIQGGATSMEERTARGEVALFAVFALAAGIWVAGKQWCLRRRIRMGLSES